MMAICFTIGIKWTELFFSFKSPCCVTSAKAPTFDLEPSKIGDYFSSGSSNLHITSILMTEILSFQISHTDFYLHQSTSNSPLYCSLPVRLFFVHGVSRGGDASTTVGVQHTLVRSSCNDAKGFVPRRYIDSTRVVIWTLGPGACKTADTDTPEFMLSHQTTSRKKRIPRYITGWKAEITSMESFSEHSKVLRGLCGGAWDGNCSFVILGYAGTGQHGLEVYTKSSFALRTKTGVTLSWWLHTYQTSSLVVNFVFG